MGRRTERKERQVDLTESWDLERLYTARESASLLELSYGHFLKLVRRELIPVTMRVKRRLFFRLAELVRFQISRSGELVTRQLHELSAALRWFAELELPYPGMHDDVQSQVWISYGAWRQARRVLGLPVESEEVVA